MILGMWYWECDIGNVILGIWYWEYDDKCNYVYLYQLFYMYKISSSTYSIEQSSIYQPKNIDVVITTPGALGKWSHNNQIWKKNIYKISMLDKNFC